MKENFQACLAFTLKWEGGYSNNPHDPGGETNFGVTQWVYDQYRRMISLPKRSVKLIGHDEVEGVYRRLYWGKAGCDDIPAGVDGAVFDLAVNSGVLRAVNFYKSLPIGLPVGEQIDFICDARMRFLRSLSTFSVFGKGWMRRVEACRIAMKKLAAAPKVIPIPVAGKSGGTTWAGSILRSLGSLFSRG